jgi:hypothetical protein
LWWVNYGRCSDIVNHELLELALELTNNRGFKYVPYLVELLNATRRVSPCDEKFNVLDVDF